MRKLNIIYIGLRYTKRIGRKDNWEEHLNKNNSTLRNAKNLQRIFCNAESKKQLNYSKIGSNKSKTGTNLAQKGKLLPKRLGELDRTYS